MWWTGATFKELVATGKIAPLDDVWEQMISSGQYEKATQDLFKVDGKTYAVPLSVSRWVVLYNKKMFADNGLAEPKTWDDLMKAAEKLKSAGITPFEATVQEGWRGFIWFEELMIRTDPKAYKGLHDGSVPYDSAAVQKAFQLWSDMYAKGYFTDPRSNEEAQDFARGKAAMYLIGEWAEGIVENAGLKADSGFGAFIMPNVDPNLPPSVIVEAGPIVVSTAGKEKKDVMTAVNFWTSVDGANVWAKASGNFEGNIKGARPQPDRRQDLGRHEGQQLRADGTLVGGRAAGPAGRTRGRTQRLPGQSDHGQCEGDHGPHAGAERRLLGVQAMTAP